GQDLVRQLPSTSEADQEQMDGVMTPPAGGSSGATATKSQRVDVCECGFVWFSARLTEEAADSTDAFTPLFSFLPRSAPPPTSTI
ncbi:hypothetical protein KUCAC02_024116, partial [Chaenocephalus aceratus]